MATAARCTAAHGSRPAVVMGPCGEVAAADDDSDGDGGDDDVVVVAAAVVCKPTKELARHDTSGLPHEPWKSHVGT